MQWHEAAAADARKQQQHLVREGEELRAALAAAQKREEQQGRLLADVTNLAAAQKAQLKVANDLVSLGMSTA